MGYDIYNACSITQVKKNEPRKDYHKDGKTHIHCAPETNLEYSKVSATIILNPGESICVMSPHGTVGSAKARELKEGGKTRRK